MYERPMRELLKSASRRLSLHMPGAQGRAPFGRVDFYRLETTELPVTDDLYRPTGAIARAQALAAKSAGAEDAIMLTGGGTAGVQAMLLYAARRGDTVILPRTVHLSALNICAVAGLRPVLARLTSGVTGRPYVPLSSYIEAMDAHPEAKAVLVTRPDYYGALGDAEAVFAAARSRGMLALCDEAHGAHMSWDAEAANAGACGASIFVQSAHKTLPALNGCAWLFAMEGADIDRLRGALKTVQTSSPSFASLMALDDARAWMDANGRRACARLREALRRFHIRASALGYTDGQDEPDTRYDPLRLVLNAPQGGYALAEALAERGLDVEMADNRRIVCILSLMDGEKRLARLLKALGCIPAEGNAAQIPPPPCEPPPRDMPLDIAAFAPSEAVPLARAVGRVSASHAGLYPPGTALITAGERITEDIADYLSKAPEGSLFGITPEGCIRCVMEETSK